MPSDGPKESSPKADQKDFAVKSSAPPSTLFTPTKEAVTPEMLNDSLRALMKDAEQDDILKCFALGVEPGTVLDIACSNQIRKITVDWGMTVDEVPSNILLENVRKDCLLEAPSPCGYISNLLGEYFTNDPMKECAKKGTNLDAKEFSALQQKINNTSSVPSLIRIEIFPAHSYTLFITSFDSKGPSGYLYQSNVATLMKQEEFSLFDWLNDTQSKKINILEHLSKLQKFVDTKDLNEKKSLYRELYMCNSNPRPVTQSADLSVLKDAKYTLSYEIRQVNCEAVMRNIAETREVAAKFAADCKKEMKVETSQQIINTMILNKLSSVSPAPAKSI